MKRPLCTVGFTLLFSLLCLNLFVGRALTVWVMTGSAVLFVLLFLIKKISRNVSFLTVLFTVFLSCVIFLIAENNYNHTTSLCKENASVTAVVAQSPEFSKDNGRYYCVMNLKEIDGKKAKGKIRLSVSETYDSISHNSFEIGDRVSFKGTVYKTGNDIARVQNYFKSQKIYVGAYNAENLKIEKPEIRGLYFYASFLKDKAVDIILRHFGGDTAGLMIAVLTGDKSYISDEFYNCSKLAGVIHLMAVSGLHLSVWVFVVGAVLERKGKKSKLAYIAMMAAVIFMMFFASFTGSVRRAGFMTLLYLVGKILGKNSDALNSLGFSLAVILTASPYSVFDVGFLLSLLSTSGILIMAFPLSDSIFKRLNTEHAEKPLYKLLVYVAESVLVSVSVAVFTFPVMYYQFGYISSVSVISNLLILFFSMPLVVLTGVFVLTSLVPFFSVAVGVLCRLISIYIIKTVMFMGSLPFARISLHYDFLKWWTVLFSVILFLWVIFGKRGKKLRPVLVFILALCFSLGITFETALNHGSYTITNAGEESVLISSNSRGVLVGVSGEYYSENNIIDILERKNIKLDIIIPCENSDRLIVSYLAHKYDAQIIENDCEITIFNNVKIKKSNETIEAYGNGKNILIYSFADLQRNKKYDIIFGNLNDDEIIIRRKR